MHALIETGVNADGHGRSSGCTSPRAEDGAGWLAFFRDLTARGFRDLTARGLTGVRLVTSDAHHGLGAAVTSAWKSSSAPA